MKLFKKSPFLFAIPALAGLNLLCSSCAQESLGSTPSKPVSFTTGLANNSLAQPDPGIKPTTTTKIDTGIDPKADRKNGQY